MNNKSSMIAIVGIVALVLGGIGGYAAGEMKNDTNDKDGAHMSVSEANPKTDTKAADLRVAFNNALSEHIELASPALRAVFDGSADTEGVVAALDKNTVDIATAVDSVYPGTKDDFLTLWRNHIGFFVDYTKAAKAGDAEGMKVAKDKLAGYADDASTFFSNANPNLPKEALKEGLTEHLNQVLGIVDAYGAGDYAKSYDLQRAADKHMQMFGDTLSSAIVKQSPDKF